MNIKTYNVERVYMNITKLDKTKARKLYCEGRKIYLLPSKVRFCLNAPFMAPYEISWESCNGRDFDRLANEYKYYNCNEELGKLVHYYFDKDQLINNSNSFANGFVNHMMGRL
jgi:hypothetical protein